MKFLAIMLAYMEKPLGIPRRTRIAQYKKSGMVFGVELEVNEPP